MPYRAPSKRKYPHGVPIGYRTPKFTKAQTGRLTHLEYNMIDMSRRVNTRDVQVLHKYLEMEYEATLRLWNRMKHCGLVKGEPSAYTFTSNALGAFLEADRWMLEPDTKPIEVGPGRGSGRKVTPDQLRLAM